MFFFPLFLSRTNVVSFIRPSFSLKTKSLFLTNQPDRPSLLESWIHHLNTTQGTGKTRSVSGMEEWQSERGMGEMGYGLDPASVASSTGNPEIRNEGKKERL